MDVRRDEGAWMRARGRSAARARLLVAVVAAIASVGFVVSRQGDDAETAKTADVESPGDALPSLEPSPSPDLTGLTPREAGPPPVDPGSGRAVLAPPVTFPQLDPPPLTSGSGWSPAKLYVQPNSLAAQQAFLWQDSNPAGAALLRRVAATPQARWFVNQASTDIQRAVDTYVTAAAAADAMPVLVAYHIPDRDCGSHSAGGAGSVDAYAAWIRNFAAGIGNRPAVVILEPDALPQLTACLEHRGQEDRLAMLRNAVEALKAGAATRVYLDAGTPASQPPETIAGWLHQAGVSRADGFSLNVSNFHTTASTVAYGKKVSAKIDGKHFVIDTSRNGNGRAPDQEWCNPPDRALGSSPVVNPPVSPFVDALLWIKTPGQSDGTCNGGPASGTWWPEYLVDLALRAGW